MIACSPVEGTTGHFHTLIQPSLLAETSKVWVVSQIARSVTQSVCCTSAASFTPSSLLLLAPCLPPSVNTCTMRNKRQKQEQHLDPLDQPYSDPGRPLLPAHSEALLGLRQVPVPQPGVRAPWGSRRGGARCASGTCEQALPTQGHAAHGVLAGG